jgi:hypothetical protein
VNEVSTWGVNAASEMPNKAIPKYDNPPLVSEMRTRVRVMGEE